MHGYFHLQFSLLLLIRRFPFYNELPFVYVLLFHCFSFLKTTETLWNPNHMFSSFFFSSSSSLCMCTVCAWFFHFLFQMGALHQSRSTQLLELYICCKSTVQRKSNRLITGVCVTEKENRKSSTKFSYKNRSRAHYGSIGGPNMVFIFITFTHQLNDFVMSSPGDDEWGC